VVLRFSRSILKFIVRLGRLTGRLGRPEKIISKKALLMEGNELK